jgi:hypothetical protein
MRLKGWLVTLAAGYAGIGAVTYLMYRAAYEQTRDVRAWTEQTSAEIAAMLDQAKHELRMIRS